MTGDDCSSVSISPNLILNVYYKRKFILDLLLFFLIFEEISWTYYKKFAYLI